MTKTFKKIGKINSFEKKGKSSIMKIPINPKGISIYLNLLSLILYFSSCIIFLLIKVIEFKKSILLISR